MIRRILPTILLAAALPACGGDTPRAPLPEDGRPTNQDAPVEELDAGYGLSGGRDPSDGGEATPPVDPGKPGGTTCGSSEECTSARCFHQGLKQLGICVSGCATATECDPGFQCLSVPGSDSSICLRPGTLPLGADCVSTAECASAYCLDAYENVLAPSGTGGVAGELTQVGQYCSAACLDDTDCPADFYCSPQPNDMPDSCVPRGKTGFGLPCRFDADCSTLHCHIDPGNTNGIGECTQVCAADASCPPAYACDDPLLDGSTRRVCKRRGALESGALCQIPADCASRICLRQVVPENLLGDEVEPACVSRCDDMDGPAACEDGTLCYTDPATPEIVPLCMPRGLAPTGDPCRHDLECRSLVCSGHPTGKTTGGEDSVCLPEGAPARPAP